MIFGSLRITLQLGDLCVVTMKRLPLSVKDKNEDFLATSFYCSTSECKSEVELDNVFNHLAEQQDKGMLILMLYVFCEELQCNKIIGLFDHLPRRGTKGNRCNGQEAKIEEDVWETYRLHFRWLVQQGKNYFIHCCTKFWSKYAKIRICFYLQFSYFVTDMLTRIVLWDVVCIHFVGPWCCWLPWIMQTFWCNNFTRHTMHGFTKTVRSKAIYHSSWYSVWQQGQLH